MRGRNIRGRDEPIGIPRGSFRGGYRGMPLPERPIPRPEKEVARPERRPRMSLDERQ